MLKCIRCGAAWPDTLHNEWGSHHESSGYGPDPRCVAIIPSKQTGDGQVCGGMLRAEPDPADPAELYELSAIDAPQRERERAAQANYERDSRRRAAAPQLRADASVAK